MTAAADADEVAGKISHQPLLPQRLGGNLVSKLPARRLKGAQAAGVHVWEDAPLHDRGGDAKDGRRGREDIIEAGFFLGRRDWYRSGSSRARARESESRSEATFY